MLSDTTSPSALSQRRLERAVQTLQIYTRYCQRHDPPTLAVDPIAGALGVELMEPALLSREIDGTRLQAAD